MILICSAGHIHNTDSVMDTWWRGYRTEGGRCPEVLSYDRMNNPPTTRCNRVLKDIDKIVEKLYHNLYHKWYSGNDPLISKAKMFHLERGDTKEQLYKLLMEGRIIKTGYTCSAIRDCHDHWIFELPK